VTKQENADDFYAAGRQLAEHIADLGGKEVSTASLQALIRDLLPQREELQEALRSIAARPDFLQLVKLASSGQGGAQKCAFIESLKNIYSAKTVEAADRLVCGVLGLSVKTAHDESEGQKTTVNTFSHKLRQQGTVNDAPGSFYADSPSRLALLSVLSFGAYTFLWTYRHWRHYKRVAALSNSPTTLRKNDGRILPFWSAFFGRFYIVGAARRIRLRLNELGLNSDEPRPWLVFTLFSLVPSLINLLQASESVFTNAVLLAVSISIITTAYMQPAHLQRLANQVLQQESGERPRFRSLNAWDWLFILAGGIFSVLYITGMLVPPSLLES